MRKLRLGCKAFVLIHGVLRLGLPTLISLYLLQAMRPGPEEPPTPPPGLLNLSLLLSGGKKNFFFIYKKKSAGSRTSATYFSKPVIPLLSIIYQLRKMRGFLFFLFNRFNRKRGWLPVRPCFLRRWLFLSHGYISSELFPAAAQAGVFLLPPVTSCRHTQGLMSPQAWRGRTWTLWDPAHVCS